MKRSILYLVMCIGSAAHGMEKPPRDPQSDLAKLSQLQKAEIKNVRVVGFDHSYGDNIIKTRLQQTLRNALDAISIEQSNDNLPKLSLQSTPTN